MGDKTYERLKEIVGEKNVSDNFFELINNTLDALPYDFDPDIDVLPHAVVKPRNEREISEIFRFANQENIPVYPKGSGTSFTGSARAPKKGIILSTGRINFIDIDTDNGYFECGPGATVNRTVTVRAPSPRNVSIIWFEFHTRSRSSL